MRKSFAAAALLATLATSAPASAQDNGSSADNACGSVANVLLLYEITLMSPKRCTNFATLPMDAKLLILETAGMTKASIADPQCLEYRLDMRFRLENAADADPVIFCKKNRSIFQNNPILNQFVTGSSSKPKN